MISDYFRFLLLAATVSAASAPDEMQPGVQQNAPDSTSVTLLFAGDIMQHGPQIEAAWNPIDSIYDYHTCFQYVKPFVSKADFAIANLELTLAGKPYSGYPQFSAPDELAVAARDAGFDVLATANNHCCDRGKAGLERTIRILDSLSVLHTGTFADSSDYLRNNPLILRKNNISIALLNYTYGTNGLPVHEPDIVNRIDSTRIVNDLAALKRPGIDFVLVFFHWGVEYQAEPTREQESLAELCRANGADAVIGSHPHVLEPMRYEAGNDSMPKDWLIVYSLGNYVSNQRDRYKDGGAMVRFTLSKTWNQKRLLNPEYLLTWVYTPYENGKKHYYILPVNRFENDSSLDAASREKINQFAVDSRSLLNGWSYAVPEATEQDFERPVSVSGKNSR